mgnify:CR=1 FL=1
MSMGFSINGPCLVKVKGRSNSLITSLSDLGLAESEIRVLPRMKHQGIKVDCTGSEVDVDEQWMFADALIKMKLVYFDREVMDNVMLMGMGQSAFTGMAEAGTLMGGGAAADSDVKYLSLSLLSPVGNKPWHFPHVRLTDQLEVPLGTKRSVWDVTFRAVPYGPFADGRFFQIALWDYSPDT